MKVSEIKQFENKLKNIRKRVAKERDDLRDLIGEMKDLEADLDESLDDLDRAADALSRLQ